MGGGGRKERRVQSLPGHLRGATGHGVKTPSWMSQAVQARDHLSRTRDRLTATARKPSRGRHPVRPSLLTRLRADHRAFGAPVSWGFVTGKRRMTRGEKGELERERGKEGEGASDLARKGRSCVQFLRRRDVEILEGDVCD